MFATKSAMRLSGAKTFAGAAWAPATRAFVPKTGAAIRAMRTAAAPKNNKYLNMTFAQGLAGGLLLAGLHSATGSRNEFYDYRFKAQNADADDLATFYGAEDFMELYCVFPFVGQIMMRNGEFDEKGDVITQGFPGTMKVSMVFSEESEGGQIEWFNKRERFHNTLFGYTMWDMVTNFGFRTLDDGTLECYHFGEYFHGNLPIVSQAVLMVFKIHARWVAWSTEHHINHYAFIANTEEEEEWEEESRKQMPIFLLKHFFMVDLKAMLFGVKKEDEGEIHHESSPSFLVRRGSDEDSDKLPIQHRGTMVQIHKDIASDRAAVKKTLAKAATQTKEEAKVVLARTYTHATLTSESKDDTAAAKSVNAYSAASEAARSHLMARRSLRDMSGVDLKAIAAAAKKEEKPKKKAAVSKTEVEGEHVLERRSSSVGA